MGATKPEPAEEAAGFVVRSFSGRELPALPIPADRLSRLEADLASARAAWQTLPNEENTIWLGRRLAYLGRYGEAIDVFSAGLGKWPRSYRLLRHRGHRYITARELDRAIADLSRAAELIQGVADETEADGAPNARNIPRSTNHSNIYYHLGLAHYLKGDFARALGAYERCMEFSRVNDDMLAATSHWLYMTLRRLGREEEAAAVAEAIRRDMDVIENHAYHRLLLMYKGELRTEELLGGERGAGDKAGTSRAIDDATIGYGLGNWHWCNGDRDEATRLWERVLSGENWATFGFIAAEAEVSRDAQPPDQGAPLP